MRNKLMVITVAICICIPLSILAVAEAVKMMSEAPGIGVEGIVNSFTALLNNNTKVSITQNVVTITPISEIALAKLTAKMTTVYKRTWAGSECVVVAEQEFAVKYGYDTSVAFSVIKAPASDIDVPDPKILSVEAASGAPKILYKSDGWINGVSPEDMIAIGNQLQAGVRDAQQVKEHIQMLHDIMYGQLKALQKQLGSAPKS